MSDFEGMEAGNAADPDSFASNITLSDGDLEIIISTDNSSIQFESNYDILACYVHDDSLDLEEFFRNTEYSGIDLPLNVQHEENLIYAENSAESDNELAILLEELRQKYASDASDLGCFQSNPLLSNNSQYRVFLTEHTEDRTQLFNWCTCTNCILMPTTLESICCKEIANVENYIGDFSCIIEHEFFNIFCEREETVDIILRTIGQIQNTPHEKHLNR
ncbi:uncharacterized protein LOC122935458 [Bufo gargarizans]|uniref:uncharacterized protein LOC122935458 n=1 Tax=Bufo gargarizans TaxID=30331 RepID=UPI001CF40067|nr:uncharacterized protein LOC122935458 [Bufo gargarizans]